MTLRVVFLGTPAFAAPSLQALLADNGMQVLGVMTQPDRPAGRGQKLTPPPVKVLAESHGLDVRQPVRLRKEPDMIDWLRQQQPDFLVTAAFGQILPQEVLDIPKHGTVNVHASLLPHYRGANPVQWAILNGDAKTGVTTMLTSLGVDEGPMLLKIETDIDPDETAADLVTRLAVLGASILPGTLKEYASGRLKATEQDASQATHAPKLDKDAAMIDWHMSAELIHNKIRGQQPWPGAATMIENQIVKIHKSLAPQRWADSKEFMNNGKPGEIIAIIKAGIVVQTGSSPLLIESVQPPGKPKMAARDWANGAIKHDTQPLFHSPEKVEI